jgi:hypothetical protein
MNRMVGPLVIVCDTFGDVFILPTRLNPNGVSGALT